MGDAGSGFQERSGSWNWTALWVGGEEVLGEVLAQLAGIYAVILPFFTPAQKSVGCIYQFHHQYLESESCLPESSPNDNFSCSCMMPGDKLCRTFRDTNRYIVSLCSNEEKCFWSVVTPQANPYVGRQWIWWMGLVNCSHKPNCLCGLRVKTVSRSGNSLKSS